MIDRSSRNIIAAIVATSIAVLSGSAWAQDFARPDTREPPYEQQMLRLSEILGSIHYLRRLCNADEGSLWRDEMQALIDTELPSPIRRARIIDRFNRGFETFRAVYRTCTPAAALAINRYMEEGVKISRDITVRYGE